MKYGPAVLILQCEQLADDATVRFAGRRPRFETLQLQVQSIAGSNRFDETDFVPSDGTQDSRCRIAFID